MPKKHKIFYYDVEQGSEEWKKLRENQFTGSNAHLLLTSFGAGSWAQSKDSHFGGNFYTKRGHLLETEALELYELINNVKVQHTGFVTNTRYPNCLYSPDGFLPDRTIEVKAFGVEKHLETIKQQPVTLKAQVQFGQMIMERPLTDVLLYNPTKTLKTKEMLVIIQMKKDKAIHDNFKRKIKAYNDRQN